MEQTPVEEREEFVKDVLTTAIECDGCGYWGRWGNVTRDAKGNVTSFTVVRESTKNRLDVTPATVEAGIHALKQKGFAVRDDIRRNVLFADVMNDATDIDVEVADVIVQAGLFGEIVYG